MVDGLVGGADLFANEVTMALGGDPAAGLRLNDRLRQRGIAVDVVHMTDFRRSNVALHVGKLQAIAAARDKAEREEARREEAAQVRETSPGATPSAVPKAGSN
jgi:predicted component of type VI protein secretion system